MIVFSVTFLQSSHTSELQLDFQPTSRSSGGAATDRCAREVRNGDGGEGR